MAFSDGDSAAATIAATIIPAVPPVNVFTTKSGRISSVRCNAPLTGDVLVEREQHDANRQEQRELGEHDDPAEHQPQAGVPGRARGEEPLHQVLVGAVRGQRQGNAPADASPERIRGSGSRDRSSTLNLPAASPTCHDFRPSARNAHEQAPRTRPARRPGRRTSAQRRSRSPPRRRRAPCRQSWLRPARRSSTPLERL